MWAGMSRSMRHNSRQLHGIRARSRTVVRYLARNILKAIDRVNDFEVMLSHVQVTVCKVLEIPVMV